MKQKLRMFVIHQTATSLQHTDNLNPRTGWYPVLDESNRMKSTCFTIKSSFSKWLSIEIRSFLKALVSHPTLSQFNRTFHKTNWPPLHWIPILPERKEKKIMPISKYQHEGEPVSLMLIMVSHDATWDFIPSLGGGLRGVFSNGTLV
jgi:hypothetical protein